MRWLGVDYGRRRIGLARSDASGTIARPWQAVAAAGTPAASARLVADLVTTTGADPDDAIAAIVVGLPRRLNGDDTDLTPDVRAFAAALETATGLSVSLVDERLTSVEAESRLAVRERDWRRRKAQIDAAAAAIVLQDHLDAFAPTPPAGDD
ncbi:MAG TPA: Holliday junction resolvase RuvX [Vicinamibacterales bacterium]|jgi:putative Holliday junction resolvase|nr:Holliday junction resolvase RuvX [Vicinamibacterales bacterium]